ncbi:MAG: glycosyltransferase, partial [Solirubrobacteraceae bacterium]
MSVVHVTHRREPAVGWFVDSLARQLEPGDQVEVIFVDGLHDAQRSLELDQLVGGRFPFRHVPSKPNPWNGSHRLTTRSEYAALSSARNTGIVYATAPYVVFVDDLCVLMPGWWEQVRRAASERLVIGGAYRKDHEMVVRAGTLVSSSPVGVDCRWE